MNAELTDLPVHALSAGLADKRFTARDIVDACLTRIDALEPKLAAPSAADPTSTPFTA